MREIKFKCLTECSDDKVELGFPKQRWATYDLICGRRLFPEYKQISPDLQYTGLKDKNGKEIYEGDIIQHGAGLILIVTFCNGKFCSTYNNSCETICGGIDNTDEIIGNIYQDKHLIK